MMKSDKVDKNRPYLDPIFIVLYQKWTLNLNKGPFSGFFIVLFIVPYRFYHFEVHLSNGFYQASINRYFFIDKIDNGHLSISAGA